MKLIEDYLKNDLGNLTLPDWESIRSEYLLRSAQLLKRDYQSPSYLSSISSLAGRREGTIKGNINDYTRDQHDLSIAYEKKFAKEYLPKQVLFPLEPYVTSSGMAALSTILALLHRKHGTNQTVMVGKHSYFQNLELLSKSFATVIIFDENDQSKWEDLINIHQPLALFIDSMCNETELTVPPALQIAKFMKNNLKSDAYLVLDNSMIGIKFPFNKLMKNKTRKLNIVVWESLNKYYQFGLDRTTGGVVWGNFKLSMGMLQARYHAGTIMSDVQVAMLPTPNKRVMDLYLDKIENNSKMMQLALEREVSPKRVKAVRRARTAYGFDGAQIVIEFAKKPSYEKIQTMIKSMIRKAKRERLQLVAGSSFGMPNTRVYLTARQTSYAQMFLRISVGTESSEIIEKLSEVIASSL